MRNQRTSERTFRPSEKRHFDWSNRIAEPILQGLLQLLYLQELLMVNATCRGTTRILRSTCEVRHRPSYSEIERKWTSIGTVTRRSTRLQPSWKINRLFSKLDNVVRSLMNSLISCERVLFNWRNGFEANEYVDEPLLVILTIRWPVHSPLRELPTLSVCFLLHTSNKSELPFRRVRAQTG